MARLIVGSTAGTGSETTELQRSIDGAAHVAVSSLSADYRPMVTPTILGTPTPKIQVDGVGTASLIPYWVLATVNPGDDVTGAGRLMDGYPDTVLINTDSSVEIVSDTAINNVYLIAVGNTSGGPTTAAPANYTGNAYIVANTEADGADWLANMAIFTFDSSDSVKRVRISVTPVYGTNYVTISVEGYSYA